jgi:hypothetical protein
MPLMNCAVQWCLLLTLQVLAADTRRAALLAEEEQLLSDTLDADDDNTTTATATAATTATTATTASAKSKASSKQQQQQPLSEEQWSANMARLSAIGEELAAIGADAAEGIATDHECYTKHHAEQVMYFVMYTVSIQFVSCTHTYVYMHWQDDVPYLLLIPV